VIPQAYLENVARYVRNGAPFSRLPAPSFGTPLVLARTPLGAILPTEPTGNVSKKRASRPESPIWEAATR
jgi:hypothetical protein